MRIDSVSQSRYISIMKTATIPPIRIESTFRQEIEQSLGDGETMASLVENAVRTEVTRRRDQSEFVRRGLAAIARSEADGDWIPAEVVLAKLEAKVVAARERQRKHQQ
ncbi:YlcI/YnfO family protein [Rhodoferax sp.]|uniref:YlcI/YnfO family protein n=1 Tax=Rhodoferax sp. TaxID=50421 RepID=UPI0026069803|nr:YlcI/YnfO family protein [Rhodoferax sp.]MDD3935262.1 hypothetical protein [Rhodoferax sp.]